MPHREFLNLVQMVDANRRVAGQDEMGVIDSDVAAAAVADAREIEHLAAVAEIAHEAMECPECAAVRVLRAALWEVLHGRGVQFPMDVWEESPMTLQNPERMGASSFDLIT